MAQIRTKDFWDYLRRREVDLIIGGIIVERDQSPEATDFDVLEWEREDLCLLTNLSQRKYPGNSISAEELRQYPLILPEGGIIIDAIRMWYGDDYRKRLKLEPPVLDVYHVMDLLRLNIIEGFMVSTETVAGMAGSVQPISEQPQRYTNMPVRKPLRLIRLGTEFKSLQIVSGLFGRRGEQELYEKLDKKHPLAVFWKVFEEHARRRKSP